MRRSDDRDIAWLVNRSGGAPAGLRRSPRWPSGSSQRKALSQLKPPPCGRLRWDSLPRGRLRLAPPLLLAGGTAWGPPTLPRGRHRLAPPPRGLLRLEPSPRGRHRLAPPPRGQHRLEPWPRGRHRLAHTLLLSGDTVPCGKKARRRGHSDEAQEGRLRRGRIYHIQTRIIQLCGTDILSTFESCVTWRGKDPWDITDAPCGAWHIWACKVRLFRRGCACDVRRRFYKQVGYWTIG